METLFDRLQKDIRFVEGLKACINCGTCTAICPAAAFYKYDPRQIAMTVQRRNEEELIALLKSDTIWYCGECMSCKTRCPRGNTPGLIIAALRGLSQDMGYFIESEKGRQQLAIKRTVGEWTLQHGYCLYLEGVGTDLHPEQGPVWDWIQKNWREVYARIGANYQGDGPGVLRKIPQETLDELKSIFDVSGATRRFEIVESLSARKAAELQLDIGRGRESEYFLYVYNTNNHQHCRS